MTLSPASPKALSFMMIFSASMASSVVEATKTPLPAARPSALITRGALFILTWSSAWRYEVNTLYSAVGIRYFFMKSFEKTLLDSSCAAAFVGPTILLPSFSNISTMPFERGSSGPTIVRSIHSYLTKSRRASKLSGPTSIHSARSEIPAFPGVQ